jgi:hypothetical protein
MNDWVSFSDRKILEIQTEIDNYRNDFFKRSSGVQLPNTICVGGLEKFSRDGLNLDYFVSMPIKNQEKIVSDVLQELISNMDKSFKLGLLFDNCDDNSFTECKNFFLKTPREFEHLQEVYFIKSDGELFEASAENILFKLCSQRYFVSIQSDIYFADESFLERSELAFSLVPDLFAISGKALVSFKVLTKLKSFLNSLLHSLNFVKKFMRAGCQRIRLGYYLPRLGYFGDLSSPPDVTMRFKRKELNTLYLGEALIRGPVIWNAEMFRKLGGYNDVAHPLGRDDCDLCFRAYLSGYVSGYLPCRAFSIFNQGTTRKKRSTNDQRTLDERNLLATKIPSQLLEYWNGRLDSISVKQLKQQKNRFKNIYGNSIFLIKKS